MKLSKDEIEFLRESNYIEREYSRRALEDAKKSWEFGLDNRDNFILDYVLGVHENLMYRLRPDIAGKFRECGVRIGNEIKWKPEKGELETRIQYWIDSYNFKKENIAYGDIKNFHIQFEKIHPFEDGNGRVERILMNVQMLNADLPLIIIHEGVEQQEYYRWFD